MKSKEIFLTALDTFIAVTTETESHHKIIQLGQSYRERIQVFRVLVPIVGSFNVGKSSLINAYLNLEVGKGLPTDIIPKTALATEILPTSEGEDEVIQIFDRKGHLISEMDLVGFAKYGLNDITETHKQASYARAKLNSETLVANPRTTLVDMPGLDSGIRSHNEAIQRYLPLGSYFILVIDIERGAFRESEIIQLGEFLSQEIECTVILNKLDRKRTDGESVTRTFSRSETNYNSSLFIII